jgi:3-deoxy-D-manno-oct-2-ulosonic acid (Kdo) hydroxylase
MMGEQISSFEQIAVTQWERLFAAAEQCRALSSLEHGKVLYFPDLSFKLSENRDFLFESVLADRKNKNISYNPRSGSVKGTVAAERERLRLQEMIATFSATVARFVSNLLPRYAERVERGRASYRPVEIAGREYSRLKDDRLLHIDAFPSSPTRGRRILRFFSNIEPSGKPRIWHVGEPFEQFAAKFQPALGRPNAPIAWLLAAVGATRGRRSPYDQLMLRLHNAAKRDAAFQKSAPRQEMAFPAGSSWLCFTDQVVHAAIGGQHALEQTFYLDVDAMAEPARSPLKTLERMTGRKLS